MLPKLESNQKAYIEITNEVHGGSGWELGTTLWSPVNDKAGHKSWRIMEEIKPGDVIIHLVDRDMRYHWIGMSLVSTRLLEVKNQPPLPSRWAGMSPYQRVSLEKYTELNRPIDMTEFFQQYEKQLKENYNTSTGGLFYVIYGDNNELRIAQRYCALCPPWLYNLFSDFSSQYNFNPNLKDPHDHIPTENEPSYPDFSAPGRIQTVVSRVIRDTKITRELKIKCEWKCQICGLRVLLPNGKYYAEAHHLKPLGGTHRGPDVADNIIILCPNHHAEFDFGSIAIHPSTLQVIYINDTEQERIKTLAYQRNDISKSFIRYHFESIFNK